MTSQILGKRKGKQQTRRPKNNRKGRSTHRKRSPSTTVSSRKTSCAIQPRLAALKEKVKDETYEEICLDTEKPPEGYIFVPKGDVYVTRHCRAKTREAKQTVYTVYSTTRRSTRGLYVPRGIFFSVKADAKFTLSARTAAVARKDARDTLKARALLRAQFPHMPSETEEAVLGHAFLKGSGRVGRSGRVSSEEVKVRLAVEAHIRHVHTPYEELLERGVERHKAREMVWQTVKEVKARWAGRDAPDGVVDDVVDEESEVFSEAEYIVID